MFNWNELRFGKYQNQIILDIGFIGPCWIIQAFKDKKIFNKSWKLLRK